LRKITLILLLTFIIGCTYTVKETGIYKCSPNDGVGPSYTTDSESLKAYRVQSGAGWAMSFTDLNTGNYITLIDGVDDYTCRIQN